MHLTTCHCSSNHCVWLQVGQSQKLNEMQNLPNRRKLIQISKKLCKLCSWLPTWTVRGKHIELLQQTLSFQIFFPENKPHRMFVGHLVYTWLVVGTTSWWFYPMVCWVSKLKRKHEVKSLRLSTHTCNNGSSASTSEAQATSPTQAQRYTEHQHTPTNKVQA